MISAFEVARQIISMHYKVLIDNKKLSNEYFELAVAHSKITIDLLIESDPKRFTPEFWNNVKDAINHFQITNLIR